MTLNITQEGKKLNASCVITMNFGEEPDIVQQIMAGSISENKAILKGVNYSFLQRVELANYILDSFEFNDIDDNIMIGTVIDDGTDKGEIRLSKNNVAKQWL